MAENVCQKIIKITWGKIKIKESLDSEEINCPAKKNSKRHQSELIFLYCVEYI